MVTKEQKVSDFTAAFIDPREGAKTQDEGVDFTIWSKADSDKGDVVDVETYISEVQVVLEGDAPEPTPTLEPGQTLLRQLTNTDTNSGSDNKSCRYKEGIYQLPRRTDS